MSSDKGKGRVPVEQDGKSSKANATFSGNESLASRVAASASGLTRNLFSAPTQNEVSESSAAALSNAGKGTASNAGSSETPGFAESSRVTQNQGQSGQGRSSNLPEGFRAGHSEQHINQSEQDFSSFLDGIDSFTPSDQDGLQTLAPSQVDSTFETADSTADISFGEAWARSQLLEDPTMTSIPVTQSQGRSIAEQESRDGEEVLELLSGTEENFEAPEQDIEPDNYDWGLTADQVSQLRGMMNELFGPVEAHSKIAPENSLNLVPNPEYLAEGQSDSHDGVHDPNVQITERWREQWEGVLTRYQDEVWGGLLPLVKEARREVADMNNGNMDVDREPPKALRRLGAILNHLRK
ncbi:hypothetical protein B0J14DRAFT_101599 [Halenospora varia]|nr:hypothetical protein B0J14DRAFT_101599 [Halenospora varia]